MLRVNLEKNAGCGVRRIESERGGDYVRGVVCQRSNRCGKRVGLNSVFRIHRNGARIPAQVREGVNISRDGIGGNFVLEVVNGTSDGQGPDVSICRAVENHDLRPRFIIIASAKHVDLVGSDVDRQ